MTSATMTQSGVGVGVGLGCGAAVAVGWAGADAAGVPLVEGGASVAFGFGGVATTPGVATIDGDGDAVLGLVDGDDAADDGRGAAEMVGELEDEADALGVAVVGSDVT